MLLHFLLSIPSGMALVQMCITSQPYCWDNCTKLINAPPISNFNSLPSTFQNATIVTFWNCTEQRCFKKSELNSWWDPNSLESHQALHDLAPDCLFGCLLHRFLNNSRCFRHIIYSLFFTFLQMKFFSTFKVHSLIPFLLLSNLPFFFMTRWYTLSS